MRSCLFSWSLVGALVLAAGSASAQSSNDTPLNNGAEVAFFYSDPSVGSVPGAGIFGDLYWRAHTGANMINDVDAGLGGSFMEIDGYYESLYDSNWLTTPSFYDRAHTGMVGLVPALGGLAGGVGVVVAIGPSGFASPCTIAPSLCSPATAGGLCGPAGGLVGWITDITFGPTVGAGVVITAGGLAAEDIATTYLVPGGMTVFAGPPGPCGFGDYTFQSAYSTDETQSAVLAGGISGSSGSQTAGGGLLNDPVAFMPEPNETWRGNVLNAVAQTAVATGVELGPNGGGALNGRNLSVAGGAAMLGVELRDLDATLTPSIAIVGASLVPLPNPGLLVLGGSLLVVPDPLFNSTSAIWNGPVVPAVFNFTAEGVYASPLLPVPAAVLGITLFIQGAVFDPIAGLIDSTNRITVTLGP